MDAMHVLQSSLHEFVFSPKIFIESKFQKLA